MTDPTVEHAAPYGTGKLERMPASEPSGPDRAAARVLVVEDDPHICELVLLHLGLEGLATDSAVDGPAGLQKARSERFDLIVLDVMLPGLDGITVCRAIRREPNLKDMPILMLTARREESDKVNGLESGADDYLTKPFGMREFIARVRALLRRRRGPANASAHQAAITISGLHVDPARRLVRADDREIELTAHEFDLLYVLASSRGIVFSRDALMQRVWGGDTHITERSVDTLVKRLRRKIERDPAQPRFIMTVWGTGYKFADV